MAMARARERERVLVHHEPHAAIHCEHSATNFNTLQHTASTMQAQCTILQHTSARERRFFIHHEPQVEARTKWRDVRGEESK